jgi:chorismate mutase-like protein
MTTDGAPHLSIEEWRRRIDEIDRKLVELLNERSRCAMEIGRLKRAAQLPLYQPEREQEILANVARANSGPLPDTAIRRLFERILDEARSVERKAMRGDKQLGG